MSDPSSSIGTNRRVGGLAGSGTLGEIRIQDGKLLLIDYLAGHPLEEPIAAWPVQAVTVSPVRGWFGTGVRLDLGEEGQWYVMPPKQRRRETQRLIDAISEAQRGL
jgi:hypothetical protein